MSLDTFAFTGLSQAVKTSFTSVLNSLSISTENWFERTKILTVGRESYADFITRSVGTFQLFATNHSVSVDTSYITVALTQELERERYRNTKDLEDDLRKQKHGIITQQRKAVSCRDLFQAVESCDSCFALVGNAGSGKTTAFRHLTVEIARGRPVHGQKRIPVYIPLRDITPSDQEIKATKCLDSAITKYFKSFHINHPERIFHSLAKSGHLAVILDGLDEVNEDIQRSVITELNSMRPTFPKTLFCISARPYSLDIGLPGFSKWEPLSLNISERISFIEKWFKSVNPEKGRRFIEHCTSSPGFLDLGSNPLLLSILCALYHNDLDIPSDPEELYERSLSGLLGGWDAFRNLARSTPIAHLTISKRMILISSVAAELLQKRKVIFSYLDLERDNSIDKISKYMRQEMPSSEELLKTLYNDFGILIERSPGKYSFTHLTFHEYLAAKYFTSYRKELEIATDFRRDPQWFEVMQLIARMSPDAGDFMSVITWETNISNQKEVDLLLKCWKLEPICSPNIRKDLMKYLATRISDIFASIPVTISVKESEIFISLKGSRNVKNQDISRVALNTLKNELFIGEEEITSEIRAIPKLLSIIESSPYSYADLECEQKEPFTSLSASKVKSIENISFIV